MHKFSIFLVAISFLPPLAEAQSLCTASEVTYFSCPVKGGAKVVSLCGSNFKEVSDAGAFLQYRVASKGKIEMAYPEAKENSLTKFRGEFFLPAGGNYYSVSFSNGKYNYSITATSSGEESYSTEITVAKENRLISRLKCASEPVFWDGKHMGFFELVPNLQGR